MDVLSKSCIEFVLEGWDTNTIEMVLFRSRNKILKASASSKKIVHVITGLNSGGAERLLADLLSIVSSDYACTVIVLTDHSGPIRVELGMLPVDIIALPLNRGVLSGLWNIGRLCNTLRKIQPDTVETWLYHADLIGGICARIMTKSKIVWGIYNDEIHPDTHLGTKLIVSICAKLSRIVPNTIICCSRKCYETHRRMGYETEKLEIVTAGLNLSRFAFGTDAKKNLTKELHIEEGTPIIGMVARFSPEKDHSTFAKAARLILRKLPTVRFVLCGENIDESNQELTSILRSHGIEDKVFLLGRPNDIVPIIQGLSLSLLSSTSESFGLVVAEALLCGVPVVSTEVGEVPGIIGDSRFVVPIRNYFKLAEAAVYVLNMLPDEISNYLDTSRERIESNYGISNMVNRYIELW
ncbi:putative Glycosyl transferase group 1 [uncultured Woeseiaceae bacterium]|uniref:Putative Glycosyl transferase group 1 n=1 Tax=uncultured Woeseiaceae bacterium TaxID=1983305 RepID=A0A7D9D110_9GAMM|nr:putative Glycosyl transferase group 1 [uncultured Woeseiaceae bacterium]